MSSPTKKRKLNSGAKAPSAAPKGLEYFFAKQTQKKTTETAKSTEGPQPAQELTDEELARKLQDEWNQEVAQERAHGADNLDTIQSGPSSSASQTPGNKTPTNTEAQVVQETAPPEAPKEPVKKTLTLQSAGVADDEATSNIPLDESPLTFDPSLYVGSLQKHWASEGGHASYALLTRCFVLVSSTTSRIKTVDTLVNCLRLLIEGDPSSLLPAVGNSLYNY
jgi:DNA ligase 1